MKAVILAGGRGTRLAEYTKLIPKPMVKLNKKPLIVYIIEHFYNYGVKEIIIAGGYNIKLLTIILKKKFLRV